MIPCFSALPFSSDLVEDFFDAKVKAHKEAPMPASHQRPQPTKLPFLSFPDKAPYSFANKAAISSAPLSSLFNSILIWSQVAEKVLSTFY